MAADGIHVVANLRRRRKHRFAARPDPHDPRLVQAYCTCGWAGTPKATAEATMTGVARHFAKAGARGHRYRAPSVSLG